VSENRVLSKLFGTERDNVTGEWRILHNEEFYDLYCSPNIKSRTIEWMGHIARTRLVGCHRVITQLQLINIIIIIIIIIILFVTKIVEAPCLKLY
jgi:hypothetical protein